MFLSLVISRTNNWDLCESESKGLKQSFLGKVKRRVGRSDGIIHDRPSLNNIITIMIEQLHNKDTNPRYFYDHSLA